MRHRFHCYEKISTNVIQQNLFPAPVSKIVSLDIKCWPMQSEKAKNIEKIFRWQQIARATLGSCNLHPYIRSLSVTLHTSIYVSLHTTWWISLISSCRRRVAFCSSLAGLHSVVEILLIPLAEHYICRYLQETMLIDVNYI